MTMSDEIKYDRRDLDFISRSGLWVGSVPIEVVHKAYIPGYGQDSGKEPEPEPEPEPEQEKRTLSVNTVMWILSLVLGMAYVVYQYVCPLLVNN